MWQQLWPWRQARKPSYRPAPRRPARRRPALETLEERCLLTAYTFTEIAEHPSFIVPDFGLNDHGQVSFLNGSAGVLMGSGGPPATIFDKSPNVQIPRDGGYRNTV